ARPATNAGTAKVANGVTTRTTTSAITAGSDGCAGSSRCDSRDHAANTTAATAPRYWPRRPVASLRGGARATHRQPASPTARYTAAGAGRYPAAVGSRCRSSAVTTIDATTAADTSTAGGPTEGRRERATASVASAPTSAVNVTANTVSPGTAAPATRPIT